MDSTNLYAYISIIALFVCIPPAIIVSLVLIYLHYILNNIFLQFLFVFLLQDMFFLRMPLSILY
jgi:solute carrier family 35, member E1